MPDIVGQNTFLPGGVGQMVRASWPVFGAGVQWFLTLPANEMWELLAVHYRLATNATAATRQCRIEFHPISSGLINCRAICSYTQPASTTVEGFFMRDGFQMAATVAGGGVQTGTAQMGPFFIWEGDLHIFADGFQAGDNFSVVEGIYRRWRY